MQMHRKCEVHSLVVYKTMAIKEQVKKDRPNKMLAVQTPDHVHHNPREAMQ